MGDRLEILGLGIDFTNDYTQVCYTSSLDVDEPVSMSMVPGEQMYLMPTVLYQDINNRAWCIGDDAILHAKNDGEECIAGFVRDVLNGVEKSYNMHGQYFSAREVISIFFKALTAMVFRILNCSLIHDISVAIEIPERRMIEYVRQSLTELGYSEDKIRVVDHDEAFIYYITHQKKELWVNDVALFDFSKEHFVFSKLRTIRSTTPKTITVSNTDYSDILNYAMLATAAGRERADQKFFKIIQENFKKSIFSAVYLTGAGFYEDWAEASLPELCSKRRVFKGYNLYVKGSTYSAMKRYKKIDAGSYDYLFDCVGRTKVNVNLLIFHNGRNATLTLSKAGTNWYEAGAQTECILDDINKIQIIFEEPLSMMRKTVIVDIPSFPERPNKTTKVRISLAYVDDVNCIVKIEDMGFGEFFKASEMSIVKEINIEELF